MTAKLYLGTARYSSWSLRGWLLVRLAGLRAEEIFVPLAGGNSPEVKKVSPSGTVPYLEHDGAQVWESLAIAEYCADITPSLWPAERLAKARARAIAAEMHAGFRALRIAMPMVLGRNDYAGLGQNSECLADIARIEELWADTRAVFGAGGPYLFGTHFNAADAMYAPIAARLLTYQPPLSVASRAYCDAVRAHPLVAEWYGIAAKEPDSWKLEKYESLA
ncbi:glutathione S-transferase [Acidocella aminolytica]|jgi:glutathione S-transferase|uniref:Glutathione S-transferase n=1 Tax=Acidocella aminolytica 101 = DSM 11237 TaxID=1120923 RepID=A0A0D6PLT6_9PROT|nr:glutathione S-transferase [Acidocella aminolytica]GAN81734.1 glutathione S-transferase [Acidocella aminolytica 101 = DSM 11237]GBQ36107.1 glutathione S-transferase [Acidocella aminolytica 101 = DSM 11237]SHF43832.1 glutathione S-transferase [Acidocella aminolytica 101 = DSM 11237]